MRVLTVGLLLAIAVADAQTSPQAVDRPRFEVTSVKVNRRGDGLVSTNYRNGRYAAVGMTVAGLIRIAYQVQEFQLVGGPDWIRADRFDIEGTADPAADGVAAADSGLVRRDLMLRSLLADRFNLVVHAETRELPVYALVLARQDGRLGPQLRRSDADCSTPAAARGRANAASPFAPGGLGPCGTSVAPGRVIATTRTMAQLATALSQLTNTGSSLYRPIIDRTGLTGNFDIDLQFTPENMPNVGPGGPPPGLPAIDPNGPTIFTALQEQLALKLDAQRGPVEVLVVDRVTRPEEN